MTLTEFSIWLEKHGFEPIQMIASGGMHFLKGNMCIHIHISDSECRPIVTIRKHKDNKLLPPESELIATMDVKDFHTEYTRSGSMIVGYKDYTDFDLEIKIDPYGIDIWKQTYLSFPYTD